MLSVFILTPNGGFNARTKHMRHIRALKSPFLQHYNTPLSQDPLKWEHSTRTPGSVQWGPGTCPQHETIKFEVRQIPSSEIIECDRFLHVF